MTDVRRIAVNTGGGDAPGLNAVIRAVVLSAERLGWEAYGVLDSYDGLFRENGVVRLDSKAVSGITHLGGTILGTTNRGDPFRWHVKADDGTVTQVDRTQEVLDELARLEIDALIAIGGDGSLDIAHKLAQKGLRLVGVPKTIDNDLAATNLTFGFTTAVETATDAIGKLHSTAEAHERVMVVELMGRTAGWIALYAGLAGTADVILIPEIPYDMGIICEKIEERYTGGGPSSPSSWSRRVPFLWGASRSSSRRPKARSGWAESRRWWRTRSTSGPAGRRVSSYWVTCSEAAAPMPTTGCLRSVSGRPPSNW